MLWLRRFTFNAFRQALEPTVVVETKLPTNRTAWLRLVQPSLPAANAADLTSYPRNCLPHPMHFLAAGPSAHCHAKGGKPEYLISFVKAQTTTKHGMADLREVQPTHRRNATSPAKQMPHVLLLISLSQPISVVEFSARPFSSQYHGASLQVRCILKLDLSCLYMPYQCRKGLLRKSTPLLLRLRASSPSDAVLPLRAAINSHGGCCQLNPQACAQLGHQVRFSGSLTPPGW